MPPAADDPHSDRTGSDRAEAPFAAPSIDAPAADTPPPGQNNTPPIAAGGDNAEADAVAGGEPHRRRRRRRRRPPRELGPASPGPAAAQEAAGEGRVSAAATAEATNTEPWGGDRANDATGGGEAATQPAAGAGVPHDDPIGERPHRRRRRRRRPPPNAPTAAPGGLGSALPAADAATTAADADSGAGDDASAGGTDGEASSERGILRLRRPVRGRRQLPRPPGLQRGLVQPAPSEAGDLPTSGDAVADSNAAARPRPEGEFPRRRRRRRPPPRPGEAGPTGEGQSAAAAPRQANDPPRSRRGYRGPGDLRAGQSRAGGAQPQHERSGEPQSRGPGRGPRERPAGAPAGRERSDRGAHSRGGGHRGSEQRGRRGRDAAPRQLEQKLYALEAMVDRGFEDVPDEMEESGSRRVHWTIIKRTVADQKSGKVMSATYVLQREGGETEFPNLGAARTAANKTIIHPEKLTMSKAEHAAAKNTK